MIGAAFSRHLPFAAMTPDRIITAIVGKRPVKPVPYRSSSTICCTFLGVSAKLLVGPQDCWTTSILAMPS